jgi:hypothetical protein
MTGRIRLGRTKVNKLLKQKQPTAAEDIRNGIGDVRIEVISTPVKATW